MTTPESLNHITRVEIIDHRKGATTEPRGRFFVHYGKVDISIQDEGRTLKVFIPDIKPDENLSVRKSRRGV